jgi:hypothetical protein
MQKQGKNSPMQKEIAQALAGLDEEEKGGDESLGAESKATAQMAQMVLQKNVPFLVRISCAEGIYAADDSTPNTLAVLTVHSHNSPESNEQLFMFKTNTVRGTDNPEWDATFLVPGADPDCTLAITLFHSRVGMTKGKFLNACSHFFG